MKEHTLQLVLEKQGRGEFAEAKALLTDLLLQFPDDVGLLDRLAYLDIQLGLLDEAKAVLLRAVNQKPQHASLYIHLGQVYRLLAEFDQAKSCYAQALIFSPDSAEIAYQCGMLSFQQGQYRLAELEFIKALKKQPDHVEAMYNLALSLHKQEEKADQHFQAVMRLRPDDVGMLGSMIQCLLEGSCFKKAKPYCQKYVELQPRAFDMYYNLGVIAVREGHPEEAISFYHIALQIYPDYFPAINNLAVLYLEKRNFSAAKHYFTEALRLRPDNVSIQYTLSAIAGDSSRAQAPQDYIRNLFDQYADHFDQHLGEALDYCVPLKLKILIEKACPEEKRNWNVLDIGCGTGFCGQQVKPWAKWLVGVDLSPRMLEAARKKALYDELIMAENLEYLKDKVEEFDLIMAGDVLVYQGNLRPIFENSYRALKRNGWFVFSTEISHESHFTMHPTGRFGHSLLYVEGLARTMGYEVVEKMIDMTRIQGTEPLAGYYFVLQKKKI